MSFFRLAKSLIVCLLYCLIRKKFVRMSIHPCKIIFKKTYENKVKSVSENVLCLEYSILINLLTFTQRIFQDTLSVNISSAKFDKIFSNRGNFCHDLSQKKFDHNLKESDVIFLSKTFCQRSFSCKVSHKI